MPESIPRKWSDLRRTAETRLLKDPQRYAKEYQQFDASRMEHELQVYRAETEAQCEELQRQQEQLEQSLQQYRDLYESLPIP